MVEARDVADVVDDEVVVEVKDCAEPEDTERNDLVAVVVVVAASSTLGSLWEFDREP